MASTTAASNKKNGVNGLLNVRNGIIALLVLVTLWSYSVNNVTTTAVLASTIRQSTPLVLGAICGLLGERSGVINIGIEGQMLMSAFAGFLANVYIGNLGIFSLGMTLFLATLIGIAMGALLGAFLAFMSVTLKMDQIIGGTV
ncbi:MAG: hypothetical protein KC421_14890, partial [Anaerolineales bacterium]|nr:hypothetical protein [Anaerolineales bacterium]